MCVCVCSCTAIFLRTSGDLHWSEDFSGSVLTSSLDCLRVKTWFYVIVRIRVSVMVRYLVEMVRMHDVNECPHRNATVCVPLTVCG